MEYERFSILNELVILTFLLIFSIIFIMVYWYFDEPWLAMFTAILSSLVSCGLLVLVYALISPYIDFELELEKDGYGEEGESNNQLHMVG